MQRRTFLKTLAAVGAAGALPLWAQESGITPGSRRFLVTWDFDIRYEDAKSFPARLWNPLPENRPWQVLRRLKLETDAKAWEINRKNPYDARVLYAEWPKSGRPKRLHLVTEIETRDRSVPLKKIEAASRRNLPIPEAAAFYLQPTFHIPTDGKIKAKADELTRGVKDRFERVKRIYDWVTQVTFRDPKVIGCGVGHAGKMMESGYFGGKCTDISSLFVALLRAAGIPAREVFGIRLGRSHFSKALGKADANGVADITTWQHCRAEYYIPGAGWIPSDPADITKLELVEHRKYEDPRVQELKRRYLHSWEMNWVGFNHARDFVLFPKPEQYPINMLGYPYVEVEDEPLDYYDPKGFSYRFVSRELR
ncbi:transglutaminase domain-containing protein [Hydrogenimonas sp. SS33]|uniref:transglutaminase-like domain-containing protein n=1 Tax=Hydrogenimonas leucolamina TaxID=2954236 RepID=UPI00336BC70B